MLSSILSRALILGLYIQLHLMWALILELYVQLHLIQALISRLYHLMQAIISRLYNLMQALIRGLTRIRLLLGPNCNKAFSLHVGSFYSKAHDLNPFPTGKIWCFPQLTFTVIVGVLGISNI
jgi:hypothetical protein